MDIVFWSALLSPHQAGYVRALGPLARGRVTVVAQREMLPWRARMGWSVPDFGGAEVIVAPKPSQVWTLLGGGRDVVHILGGVDACALTRSVLSFAAHSPLQLGVISESPDGRGWQGILRRCLYVARCMRHRDRISFFLAIGDDARSWFSGCGIRREKIFPFLYVPESPTNLSGQVSSGGSAAVHLAYLGQYIRRKGLDILIESLIRLKDLDWRLDAVGDGPEKERLQHLARSGGVGDRIRLMPAMSNEAALRTLSLADALVLPSRFDGWGAVVNESLTLGVPVLCSDRCGARDLLRQPWCGEVFRSGSVESLCEVLAKWIARGKRTPALTRRISSWSGCIQGDTAAGYLLSVLEYVFAGGRRPLPPWEATNPEQQSFRGAVRYSITS